jgi:hypothetical protein
MAYDADGNFYNPYQPGTFEYDYEESQRSQPTIELTPEQQAQEIASQNQYRDFLATNPAYVARAEAIAAEYNKPQTSWMDTIGSTVLAVATLVNPTIGLTLGSGILSDAGIAGASTAVTAGVVAAALSAATTAVSGGTVEDVIKNAAGAGVASGLNISMGGGVAGAVTGSTAGTIIRGGDASQVLTNAFAAGVGAGVQGAMTENPDAGKILGSAARTYIATGGNVDQTLLNTALTAIGTLDNPAKTVQQLRSASTPAKISEDLVRFEDNGLTYQEQPDGTAKVTDQAGNERIISSSEFSRIANAEFTAQPVTPPAPTDATALAQQTLTAPAPVVSPVVTDLNLINQVAAQPTPTVDPKTLERVIVQGQNANVANVAPVVSPVVTDLDLVKQVAAQPTPTVDPKELERVIVQGQGANVANAAPVVAPTVTGTDLINQVAEQPAPTVEPKALEKVIVQGQRETANVANVTPVQTDITTPPPDTTRSLEPVEILGKYEYEPPEEKKTEVVTDVPSTALEPVEVRAKYEQLPQPGFETYEPPPPRLEDVTIQGYRDKPPEVTTDAPPSTPLERVEILGKYEPPEEKKVSEVVTDVFTPPTALEPVTVTPPPVAPPPPPPAPEVKAEEPKKEEPKKEAKKEAKKLYPTVTSVPPPKRPGRQPIITGASPARLLADALAAYRPAGAIEGEESGKERQNVWNEKSLRLKDALGL